MHRLAHVRSVAVLLVVAIPLAGAACSEDGPTTASPPSSSDSGTDSGVGDSPDGSQPPGDGATSDALGQDAPLETGLDAGGDGDGRGAPCTTRITYGSAWIHGPNHPDDVDVASGIVTWTGACEFDGSNSYAQLSNGWTPYFAGRGSCVIALDYDSCTGVPTSCQTRVTYGPAWKAAPNHPDNYDDMAGSLSWSGACRNAGADSYAALSNGWTPYFSGNDACDLAFRYTRCGGLYANPVVDVDCPDPGVLLDGTQYVMACTSGNAGDAFPLRTSPDLVHWTSAGHIFPSNAKPSWAASDYWAPEIHRVGTSYVAYFTARHHDGALSIGAAVSSSALGPFVDIGQPLLHDPSMGLIDASEYEDPNGNRYLLWKEDGNAVGKPTPIHAQQLAADGLSLVGTATTLITNDKAWEGALVEGPWMVDHAGQYYLFYSANGYASPSYAIGVARASSPLGPFVKAPQPIVGSAGPWAGPGHGSVLSTPTGETWHVYHSWRAGQIGGGAGRVVLLDRVIWQGDWPTMLAAPSSVSSPPP